MAKGANLSSDLSAIVLTKAEASLGEGGSLFRQYIVKLERKQVF
jgi:hypothetical protein